MDAKGRLLKSFTRTGNGFAQKLTVDLTLYASGVYLLQTEVGSKKQSFKLYRQ